MGIRFYKTPRTVTKGMRVRQAVETLFEGFKCCDRAETSWARRLLECSDPSDEEIRTAILGAIQRYCPRTPDEYVSFIVDLLSAAIRLARRDEAQERQFVAQNEVWPYLPHPDAYELTAEHARVRLI